MSAFEPRFREALLLMAVGRAGEKQARDDTQPELRSSEGLATIDDLMTMIGVEAFERARALLVEYGPTFKIEELAQSVAAEYGIEVEIR